MLEWDRPNQRAGVAVHELSPITNATDDQGRFSRWSAFNVDRFDLPLPVEALARSVLGPAQTTAP
jgi:hypothetical protein